MPPYFLHTFPGFSIFQKIHYQTLYYWYTIYIPLLSLEILKIHKKGHTYGICMRRYVLLQDSFRSILLLSSYHISY
ncbi:hypothetical protein FNE58_03685 [Bacillus thuringiensis]|uniref:Uncharacterized protein n=1 Tax=Bacillus thuringiensis TaxID=1428 RepID=A0A9X6Q7L0_BACTU|nr:hypothetical protein FPG93_30350 [Bacillus thuringiensis]OTZ09989.1 hypothetical protein BK758_02800 [Bacillus thuringiensis serovar aizawai]MDR5038731.1 hypothetical protein [Bacillus thuringiensis]OTZ10082.1 hypothetical protein BK757_27260 [Bacillus thuringiensis serovar aizawai]OTZ11864.1 hypothetical protein BK756_08855 [Bacillus thuringiensis serovar aizawai]